MSRFDDVDDEERVCWGSAEEVSPNFGGVIQAMTVGSVLDVVGKRPFENAVFFSSAPPKRATLSPYGFSAFDDEALRAAAGGSLFQEGGSAGYIAASGAGFVDSVSFNIGIAERRSDADSQSAAVDNRLMGLGDAELHQALELIDRLQSVFFSKKSFTSNSPSGAGVMPSVEEVESPIRRGGAVNMVDGFDTAKAEVFRHMSPKAQVRAAAMVKSPRSDSSPVPNGGGSLNLSPPQAPRPSEAAMVRLAGSIVKEVIAVGELDDVALSALLDRIEEAAAVDAAAGIRDDELLALMDRVDEEMDAAAASKAAAKAAAEEPDDFADFDWETFDKTSAHPSPAAIPPIFCGAELDVGSILSRLGAIGDPDVFFAPQSPVSFDRVPVFLRAVVAGITARHSSPLAIGASVLQTVLVAWHLEPSPMGAPRLDATARLAPCVIILRDPWANGAAEVLPGDIVHVVAVRGGIVSVYDSSRSARSGVSDLRWAALGDDNDTLAASASVSAFLPTWVPPIPKGSSNPNLLPRGVPVALLDARQHALILHPDILISPTRIADASTCLRRAVMQEMMGDAGGSDDGSEVKLMGTLKHELFEHGLRLSTGHGIPRSADSRGPSTTSSTTSSAGLKAALKEAAGAITRSPSSMEALYSISQSGVGGSLDVDARARKEVEGVVAGIVDWMDLYIAARVASDDAARPPFKIAQVVGVEEMIWSPVWGIKGICDANVDIEFPAPPGGDTLAVSRLRRSARLPLELKTGKRPRNGGSFENHHAQMLLYAILLKERYGGSVPSSSLVTTQAPSSHASSARAVGPRRYNCDVSAELEGAAPVGGLLVYLSSAAEISQREARDAAGAARLPVAIGGRGAGAEAVPDESAFHYTTTITTAWTLQSALLVNRNLLAVGLIRAQQAASADIDPAATAEMVVLPPIILDERLCGRCYMFAACATSYACQESPVASARRTAAAPGAPAPAAAWPMNIEDLGGSAAELFSSFLKFVPPSAAVYYARWMKLSDLEATAQAQDRLGARQDRAAPRAAVSGPLDVAATTGRTMLWRKLGVEREKEGMCAPFLLLRHQRATATVTAPESRGAETTTTPSFTGGAMYEYTFETLAGAQSLLSLNISDGDFVVASGSARGPYGLILGTVTSITVSNITLRGTRDVTLAFPHAFSPPMGVSAGASALLQPPFVWRIDRDDVAMLHLAVKDSLVRLVGGRTISWPGDGDGVPWSTLGANNVPLPGGAGRGDLKRQALVIELVAPRFFAEACYPWSATAIGDAGLSAVPSAFARVLPSSEIALSLQHEYEEVLNVDQRAAVDAVLRMRDYACLLGMPGTGKTATLSFVIRCLAALGRSVLVTSHTHNAVDNVLIKCIAAKLDVLRIGRASAVAPSLLPHCLETLVASGSFPSLYHLHARLEHAQVVGVTCLGIRHSLFARRTFDVCIVDEASQIPEPVVLGPMRIARAFILVGDHMQLPPLVISLAARVGGMDTSLFKRLCEAHPASVVKLSRQYRMNEDIQQLPNLLMYNGALSCGSETVAKGVYKLPDIAYAQVVERAWLERTIGAEYPVVFLDTDSTLDSRLAAGETGSGACLEVRADGGSGIVNPTEAAIVAAITVEILRRGGSPSDIGVIAPFRTQLRLIRRTFAAASAAAVVEGDALASDQLADVEVDTVDRFQGRDKRVIVISLVRSNAAGEIGQVLADVRRLNVAVSRAKHKLVLVGSASCLAAGSTDLAALIGLMHQRDWLVPLPWGESLPRRFVELVQGQ